MNRPTHQQIEDAGRKYFLIRKEENFIEREINGCKVFFTKKKDFITAEFLDENEVVTSLNFAI